MSNLKYYITERVKYKDAYEQKINNKKEVEIIIKKLLRHFKLRDVCIRFTTGNRHSRAGGNSILINMSCASIGLLCHEVGHTYQEQKLYNSKYENWHNKEHNKIFKKMVNYCKKKNWFKTEIERRIAEKPKKILTKDEIKRKELLRLEEKIKQYEKKIKTYTKKLGKARKGYKLRLRHLNEGNYALQSPTIAKSEVSNSLVCLKSEELK